MFPDSVGVVDGDCYGEAVNVASRLQDLSGANVTRSLWSTVDNPYSASHRRCTRTGRNQEAPGQDAAGVW